MLGRRGRAAVSFAARTCQDSPAMKTILAAALVAAAAATPSASLTELKTMTARFAPTPLVVKTDALSPGDRKALVKLIQAARVINELYMEQLWSGDADLYAKLHKDKSALGRARMHYFWLNKSPWSDLDDHRAFLPNVPARKPMGAAFYPEDMTTAQFEAWVALLPPKDAEAAKGFYSVIRPGCSGCTGAKAYAVVPYSEAYHGDLSRAAGLLRDAAALTTNASLKRFLDTRADAFTSNDYYESDVAWMDLDAPLDVTIGPYETYNDELFGYKAAFEAYVNLRDDAETAKLGFFSQHLQEIEDHLPEEAAFRSAKLGALSPIRVVNEVMSAGDGAHGVQTAAYNLPNDDRVVQQKGSKRVMLKNVQEAKFKTILEPIARQVLAPEEQKYLSFDWFFTAILAHELMHGLGPHEITVSGRPTNPRLELKNLFGAIEEAKADVTGLWALQYMLDHAKEMKVEGVLKITPDSERQLYTTYLASMFRTLRFGLTEAHGRGMAMQMNFLMDRGAVKVNDKGRFEIDYGKVKDAVRDLDANLLNVEGRGDFAGAEAMLATATLRPEVARAIDGLAALPTDIEPQFVTADQLAPR
jgi:hypothetical protein